MRTNIRLRGVALSILCISSAACGPSADQQRKVDPNLPAVVNIGPPILPGDTAKKPAPIIGWISNDSLRVHLLTSYSLLGAFLAFNDARSLVVAYHPQAELSLPDSTTHGARAIALVWTELAKRKSLGEFNRTPRAFHASWADSTVLDSGVYEIRTKRDGASPVIETGHYVTKWHVHPPPTEWTIARDEIKPDKKK